MQPFSHTATLPRPVVILTVVAIGLFAAQLLLGTELYFAAGVLAALLIVVFTCQCIGFATVGGVLIAAFAVRYLVFAQVVKTAYGQPGHTNLAAPETTIAVILVGTISMCLAALVVSRVLGERTIIRFQTSPDTLAWVRDFSFVIGIAVVLTSRAGGDGQFGGALGIAKQLTNLGYFAIMVETFRVLTLTGGKRSLSPYLIGMIAIFTLLGFSQNSKTGIALPYFAYLLAAIGHRGAMSRRQIVATVIGGMLFAGLIYPMVHILRALTERVGISAEFGLAFELLSDALAGPDFFNDLWSMMDSAPDESVYAQGLNYLGARDHLVGRFLLIANTDTIVNAVNADGIYGPALIRAGLDSAKPHFISPDKLQGSTGDVVTWYYGLRTWGEVGYPANGLLADCYAALGWLGVAVLPFCLHAALLTLLQLPGRRAGGNLVGIFLVLINIQPFCEANIQQTVTSILRGMPQYIVAIVGLFLLVDFIGARRGRAARAAAPGA